MRVSLLVCAIVIFCGCTQPAGGNKPPHRPKDGPRLEQIAFESFQKRDEIRAEKLKRLASDIESGAVKYDKNIMEAWAKIGSEASAESWRPVAEAAAEMLDPGQYDAKKTADATMQLSRGSLRASK